MILQDVLESRPVAAKKSKAGDDAAADDDGNTNDHEDEDGNVKACRWCKGAAWEGMMVEVSVCACSFHEECVGYKEGMSTMANNERPGGKELAADMYCATCLRKKRLDVDTVEAAVLGHCALAEFLNEANCPFLFCRVDGDGYCLFCNMEDFADQEPDLFDLDSVCHWTFDSAVAASANVGEGAIDGAP